jgi:hypothetical protein
LSIIRFLVGTIYAFLEPEYEKGKLCESRGRKVTDLKDKYPKMAGLPDKTKHFSSRAMYLYAERNAHQTN